MKLGEILNFKKLISKITDFHLLRMFSLPLFSEKLFLHKPAQAAPTKIPPFGGREEILSKLVLIFRKSFHVLLIGSFQEKVIAGLGWLESNFFHQGSSINMANKIRDPY